MANTNAIHNPHDKFFKSSLALKAVAIDFFKAHLPKPILNKLDIKSLQLLNNSYLTPALKELRSDVVYQCKIEGKEGYIPIILLVEHQSSPDKNMAFRLLRYTFNLMQAHINAGHDDLPLVLPLCLYHGEASPYPHSTDIYDRFQDPDLAKTWMFKPFQVIDLTTRSLEEMKQDGSAALMGALFKAYYDKTYRPIIEFIIQEGLLHDLPKDYFQSTLYYIALFDKPDLKEKELLNSLDRHLPHKREHIMTIREQIQQEGIHKAKREDAKKMLAEGISRDVIKRVTGLSDVELNS